MFRIKIEEKFNPNSEMIGKWFVKYDPTTDRPIFTDDINEAGIFVADINDKMSLYGNAMALSHRFGYNGTPVPIED